MSGMLVNEFSTIRHQIFWEYSSLEETSIATAPPEMKKKIKQKSKDS